MRKVRIIIFPLEIRRVRSEWLNFDQSPDPKHPIKTNGCQAATIQALAWLKIVIGLKNCQQLATRSYHGAR